MFQTTVTHFVSAQIFKFLYFQVQLAVSFQKSIIMTKFCENSKKLALAKCSIESYPPVLNYENRAKKVYFFSSLKPFD